MELGGRAAVHTYPKQGIRLYAPSSEDGSVDEMNAKLIFYTSIAGTEVEITHDRAFLSVSSVSSPVPIRTRIILPHADDVKRRRLALLDDPDNDLSLRCHATYEVCLHTLEEVKHLHGHNEIDSSDVGGGRKGGRMLASAATSPGVAYASISMDAFAINSNSGFVSWSKASTGGSAAPPPALLPIKSDEETIEYDKFGCIVEEGFDTQAYPLTTKHCSGFRQTYDCSFSLGDEGYLGYSSKGLYAQTVDNPIGTTINEFIVVGGLADCKFLISAASTGFCECGSGLKVIRLQQDVNFSCY